MAQAPWLGDEKGSQTLARRGGIKPWIGPRAVPARSSRNRSLTCWFFEHPGVFLRAASRDGSRYAELEAALAALANGCKAGERPRNQAEYVRLAPYFFATSVVGLASVR
jgi:hypothetical protein